MRRRLGAIAAALAPAGEAHLDGLADLLQRPLALSLRDVALYEADDRAITHLTVGFVGRVDLSAHHWTLVTLDPTIALAFADALLDRARPPRALTRPLTQLETTLLAALLARAAGSLPTPDAPLSVPLEPRDPHAELRLLAAASRTIVATFVLRCGELSGQARWLLPERTFDLLFGDATSALSTASAPLHRVQHLPLTAELALGPVRLTPTALAHMTPGAALLGPSLGPLDQPSVRWTVAGREVGSCRWDGPGTRPIVLGLNLAPTGAAMPTSPAPLAELPVEVVVRLARWTTTLAELATLAPGHVLDLDLPVHGHVTLAVGGVDVARGELVDIEGSLGVRITEALTPQPPLPYDGRGGGPHPPTPSPLDGERGRPSPPNPLSRMTGEGEALTPQPPLPYDGRGGAGQ